MRFLHHFSPVLLMGFTVSMDQRVPPVDRTLGCGVRRLRAWSLVKGPHRLKDEVRGRRLARADGWKLTERISSETLVNVLNGVSWEKEATLWTGVSQQGAVVVVRCSRTVSACSSSSSRTMIPSTGSSQGTFMGCDGEGVERVEGGLSDSLP
ncbi:hypothetical protein EYF80_028183 [Liparis tanakae]|uniref:Uncharacterized protein n=1 Tax=Liparis tanakae TaxID=230148 RepID=A0A4Z2H7F9_9TELE|nr:hypothetical protein EYF80_028183 [Liparis tanakae]